MGYLYKGLKEDYWKDAYEKHHTQVKKKSEAKKKQNAVQEQANQLAMLEQQFNQHNATRRKQMLEQYDDDDHRMNYQMDLDLNPDMSGMKKLYFRQWAEGKPGQQAISAFAGWLLKKYGEPEDSDKELYIKNRL
ncbi:hypothetical protein [Persicobacter psychrovividus]|uniref:Uncharacterized protein n=1 Tax=Persicobacter psychrovividus TaxID=387638 RepID=A0ABN6LGW0_9BACT|nr:hypothetical protein PEPS_46650 [Persicobacter psychrovividus]